MRIVDKIIFSFGVFEIVVGIGIAIAMIITHKYSKTAYAVYPIGSGIEAIHRSISSDRGYKK